MRVIYRVTIATTALLAAASAAIAAPANPLLGTWKVDMPAHYNSDGVDYCGANPEMIFTPKTQVMYGPVSPGQPQPKGTDDVIYMVSGKNIYVSSTPGFVDAPEYTMLSANEMQADRIGNCHYKRQ